MDDERQRCERWLLDYWRNVRGFGAQLTEEEHLAGLRRNGSADMAWATWQGALATGDRYPEPVDCKA